MREYVLSEISPDATWEVLSDIAPEISPAKLDPDRTLVQVADLPFYDEFKLYAVTDLRLPASNVHHLLYKPGCAVLLDGINGPIYRVNELAPLKLGPDAAASYVRFFFAFVDGPMGRFIIVEKPEDVAWLPKATRKKQAAVAARLMPLTYNGVDSDGVFTLTGTVIFQNALFRTDVKVAPREMGVPDPESDEPEHFTIGQIKLTNEELLLENLRVPLD